MVKLKLFIFTFIVFLSFACSAESLRDFKFEKRIVIADIGSLREQELDYLSTVENEINERKMALYFVNGKDVRQWRGDALTSSLRLDIIERHVEEKVLLIGLDGGNKAIYEQFDIEAIFGDIDLMPMRRAELSLQGWDWRFLWRFHIKCGMTMARSVE